MSPEKLIDFRCRPNTPEFLKMVSSPTTAPVMRRLGSPQPKSGTLEEWVRDFTARGIEHVVFTGRQSRETGSYDVDNDYVHATARDFSGKVVGFAGIDPTDPMQAVREVERVVTQLGLKGISIDPYGGNLQANDRRLYPVYAKCIELEVPVIVTCGPLPFPGPRLAHGDVRCVDDVASDMPELTIIIDHSGWPWVEETIAIAFRHENVFIDTSLYSHLMGGHMFAEAANTILPDKIMFASCYPVVPFDTAIERVASLPFTPEALHRVFYENAHTLLSRFGAI